MTDQRCGTCRHYQPYERSPGLGRCTFVLPAVPIWLHGGRQVMGGMNAGTCLTWEATDE